MLCKYWPLRICHAVLANRCVAETFYMMMCEISLLMAYKSESESNSQFV